MSPRVQEQRRSGLSGFNKCTQWGRLQLFRQIQQGFWFFSFLVSFCCFCLGVFLKQQELQCDTVAHFYSKIKRTQQWDVTPFIAEKSNFVGRKFMRSQLSASWICTHTKAFLYHYTTQDCMLILLTQSLTNANVLKSKTISFLIIWELIGKTHLLSLSYFFHFRGS